MIKPTQMQAARTKTEHAGLWSPAEPRKVAIVIPFRNQVSYLKTTLASVAATQTPRFKAEVILVDNASHEELDPAILERLGLRGRLIRNRRNRACSRPWNTGIRIALRER